MTDALRRRIHPVAHPIALSTRPPVRREFADFRPFQESTNTHFRVSVQRWLEVTQ
jgi:hypothetical protein